MIKKKKILALVMAAAMSLSVMTGCTDKNLTDTSEETAVSSDSAEITTAATSAMAADNVQLRDPVFYESSQIESVTADKTKGRLIDTATSFSIVTKTDMEASNLQNIISVTPQVNFKVDKVKNNNFRLELTDPLPENSMAVIAQNNADGEAVYKWAFQTDGRFEKKEIYPADNSDYVDTTSGIEITFTAAVNAEGAEKYFEITPHINGKFHAHRSTLYFIPSEPFLSDTRYNVMLKKGFASADGIALDEDISFSFVTRDYSGNNYCYTSNMSETFIKGDPNVVEIFCSDGIADNNFKVSLYRYDNAEAYRKAMQGFIDSGKTSTKYTYSTDGLEQIYSGTQQLITGETSWGPKFLMLPDDLEEGYYIADILVDGVDFFHIQRHIQVNPVSVYAAYVGGKAQFFINDTVSGKAADGAEINLTTADGTYSAKTDAQGIAMLDVPTDNSGDGLLEIKWDGNLYYDFYEYYKNGEPRLDDLYFSYIYLDRAIYNNDDTIKVWGVIRPRKPGLEMPADLSLELGYDGMQIPMEMNSDGTFTASLDFSDLKYDWGTAVMLVSGETILTSTYVQIKDHIKPTYDFEADIPHYVMFPQENPFKVSVQANLFEGSAAGGLTFDISSYDAISANPSTIITDSNGYAETEVLFEDSNSWEPTFRYVNVTLAGVENTYNELYAPVITFYRDIMVEDSYNADTRKLEFTVSEIISDNLQYGDNPWSDDFNDIIRGDRTDITAKMTVTRFWTEKVEKGTYYDYLQKKNVAKYEYDYRDEIMLTDSFTTAGGKYVVDIPEKEGSYQIDLEWKDSKGRITKDTYYVYINQNYNDENQEKRFTFTTDKLEFTENEAIKFSLENNYEAYEGEGRVLLQLHGTEFDDYAVYNSTSFSHVMTAECIPNVTAIGAYFDGRHVYPIYEDYYYSDLSFNPEERELVLEISSDKEKYAPGEKAVVTVTAKDKSGKIVSDADLVLSVADEASFAVANQVADPLNEIYRNIYGGYAVQYHSYVEHNFNTAAAGEMGGGGEDQNIRRNFKDTAAFLTAVTGTDGKATFEIELPDNITQWRATAVAVYEKETDFIYAGTSKYPLVVTQPLFIEPIMLDEIVDGDDLAVAAHCFGDKAGTEKITVTVTGNGVNLTKSALAGKTLNFGKLAKGEYTVRFKAESGTNSDTVEKTVVVRDSLLETNVTNSFNLADGAGFIPKSWPMCIMFYDAEHLLYTDTLYKLVHRAGERLDMRIASSFAYKEFGFITEEEYVSEFEGITSTGLAKLMQSSEESAQLTAKICAAAPELVNKSTVTKRMYDILDSEESHAADISSAYLALAALGEPVMTEIRDTLDNNEFTSTIASDKFNIEDGLRLTAALAFLGDFDTALTHYNRFTENMVTDVNKNGEDTAFLPSTELTQTAIMPAAILRLPEADSIARHLIGTTQVYDSFALELMVYLNNYTTDTEGDAVFTYTRNGKPETVTIDRHFGTHITFTEEQFKEANFAVKSGEIYAVANYKGNPTQNDTKPTLTVNKTISGDLTPGGLVTVKITVKGGADEFGNNFYTVNDVVPSCARFNDYVTGFANENGQLLTLYTNQYGVAEYTFRVTTSGKYLLESAAARNYDGKWGMSEYTTITVNDNAQNA